MHRATLGLLASLFGGVSVAAARPTADSARVQDSVIAFVHVTVVPMDRERVLQEHTVVVRGGRIAALGPSEQVVIPAGTVRVDGRGMYLLPGLADMHVHLRDPATDEASLLLFVANGVTTVREMLSGGRSTSGFSSADQNRLFALRRRVAAGELLGPRLYTAGTPDQSSPAAAAQSVAALKTDGHDFVKLYALHRPLYDSVVAAARRVGLPVVGHVPDDRPLKEILRDRWASIEHLTGYYQRVLGYEPAGLWPGPALVALVDTAGWLKPAYRPDPAQLRATAAATRKAGVWNCPTVKGWLAFFPQDSAARAEMRPTDMPVHIPPDDSLPPGLPAIRRLFRRFQEFTYWTVKALADAGAGLLVGTDVGDSNNTEVPPGFGVATELRELVRAGLTPYQALEAGTRNAARFLGDADSAGTIAVGRRADLVLLAANPLADIGAVAGPAGVMVGGRWLPRATLDAKLDSLQTWSAMGSTFDLAGVRRVMWRAPKPTVAKP